MSRQHRLLFVFVPQLVKLGLVSHVMFLALAGRHDDLVESRLRFRVPVAVIAGGFCALVVLVELWLSGPPAAWLNLVGSFAMFSIALRQQR